MPQPKEKLEAKAALEKIRKSINQVFTPEQLDELRKQLQESEDLFNRLKEAPLENGDEPAPGFRPYRKDEATR